MTEPSATWQTQLGEEHRAREVAQGLPCPLLLVAVGDGKGFFQCWLSNYLEKKKKKYLRC